MSLVGKRIAVVSLGSSCQAAHQLRLHTQLISEILDDTLEHDRLPFDWAISPIQRTSEWLRSGQCFPASPQDLTPVPDQPGAFLWREQGIYFWHDFRSASGIDLAGTFERTRAAYEHGFIKWRRLRSFERLIIVVANTQNNLPLVLGPEYPKLGFDFTAANLAELKQSAEASLMRPCEMLCVTYADRSADELESMPTQNIVVARVPRDPSGWEGDPAVWRPVLARHLASELLTGNAR